MGLKDRISVVYDMETGDPDDFLALLLLLGHPRVDLKAVTVTPGSRWQVGVVRWALQLFGSAIPVGAFDIRHRKKSVSSWLYATWGEISPSDEAEAAAELLIRVCDATTTLVTGGPLRNVARAIRLGNDRGHPFTAGRLVGQGGFAGEGVVPPEKQMDKFRGRMTCPTYNFMDHRSVRTLLSHSGIAIKRLVSKNVCHRVVWDTTLQEAVALNADNSLALRMIGDAMMQYPEVRGAKKLHDLLAACCAIDESIGEWAEVEMFRSKGEWGARLCPGSGIWIIVDYDRQRFIQTFIETPPHNNPHQCASDSVGNQAS